MEIQDIVNKLADELIEVKEQKSKLLKELAGTKMALRSEGEKVIKYYTQLQDIRNLCKVISFNDNKIKISMIEEILDGKKDIHFYLESEE